MVHCITRVEEVPMVNIYLLIELLGSANAGDVVAALKKAELSNCKLVNVVELSAEKLVGQLDCDGFADASKAVLEKIAPVEGIVQTNIMAAVRPVNRG
jgi:hypothetical protein